MNLSRIDLHMHSTVSDGTDTPLQLLEKARRAGLSFFALTDHDAISGNREILACLTESTAPRFLAGVEFSCRDEKGKYHILGYGFDPDHPAINEVVDHGHELRITLMHERVSYLKDHFSIAFPDEEITGLFALANPGKPHLADLLIRHGYAATRKEAFSNYLNRIPDKNRYLRPETAIAAILRSGGIPVLAHPFYGTTTEWITSSELESRVSSLKALGLRGLEAFHSDLDAENTKEVLALADKFDLLVTCGSDYHGDNKTVKIGGISKEETPYTSAFAKGDPEGLPARRQSFLDAISTTAPINPTTTNATPMHNMNFS